MTRSPLGCRISRTVAGDVRAFGWLESLEGVPVVGFCWFGGAGLGEAFCGCAGVRPPGSCDQATGVP